MCNGKALLFSKLKIKHRNTGILCYTTCICMQLACSCYYHEVYLFFIFGTIVTKATELSPSLDHLPSTCCVLNTQRNGSSFNVLVVQDTWQVL